MCHVARRQRGIARNQHGRAEAHPCPHLLVGSRSAPEGGGSAVAQGDRREPWDKANLAWSPQRGRFSCPETPPSGACAMGMPDPRAPFGRPGLRLGRPHSRATPAGDVGKDQGGRDTSGLSHKPAGLVPLHEAGEERRGRGRLLTVICRLSSVVSPRWLRLAAMCHPESAKSSEGELADSWQTVGEIEGEDEDGLPPSPPRAKVVEMVELLEGASGLSLAHPTQAIVPKWLPAIRLIGVRTA